MSDLIIPVNSSENATDVVALNPHSEGYKPKPPVQLPVPTLALPPDVLLDFPTYSSRDFPNLPKSVWLVRDVFCAGSVILLWGESQAGKTALLIDLMESIAAGQAWAGHDVVQTNVLYVALEGQSGLRRRVQALEHDRGFEPHDRIRYGFRPINIAELADINTLAGVALKNSVKMIVIDTLSASISGTVDENSNSAMAGVIANVQRLTQLTGAAVLIVHHTGRDPGRGERGAYALRANPDVSIEVSSTGSGRRWCVVKGRDGRPGIGGTFTIEQVTFHPSDEDEPVESIVVRHGAALENLSGSNRPSRSPEVEERNAEALKAVILQMRMNEVANGGPAPIAYEEVINLIKSAPIFTAIDSRHRKDRAKKSLDALISDGLLLQEGELLRVPENP